MNQDEQIAFVRAQAEAIVEEMAELIEDGQVPETWEGLELKTWLADRAGMYPRTDRWNDRRHARRRTYENERLVRNL